MPSIRAGSVWLTRCGTAARVVAHDRVAGFQQVVALVWHPEGRYEFTAEYGADGKYYWPLSGQESRFDLISEVV